MPLFVVTFTVVGKALGELILRIKLTPVPSTTGDGLEIQKAGKIKTCIDCNEVHDASEAVIV